MRASYTVLKKLGKIAANPRCARQHYGILDQVDFC